MSVLEKIRNTRVRKIMEIKQEILRKKTNKAYLAAVQLRIVIGEGFENIGDKS